jgi:hypothetical protein
MSHKQNKPRDTGESEESTSWIQPAVPTELKSVDLRNEIPAEIGSVEFSQFIPNLTSIPEARPVDRPVADTNISAQPVIEHRIDLRREQERDTPIVDVPISEIEMRELKARQVDALPLGWTIRGHRIRTDTGDEESR